MKRRIISLLMAALMSMTLLGTTAFALDTVDNESQGTIVNKGGDWELIPINPSDDIASQGAINEHTPQPAAIGLNHMVPIYCHVHPVVLYDGNPTYIRDYYWNPYLEPANSYFRETMILATQNVMKQTLISRGYEPIGWLLDTGYNMDADKPIRFDFYVWRADGKSTMQTAPAYYGDNYFQILTGYPATVREYKMGITGTYYYQTGVQTGVTAGTRSAPIELTVTFAAS